MTSVKKKFLPKLWRSDVEEVLWPVPALQAFAFGFGAKKDRGTAFSVFAAREMEPQVAQAHYESPEQHYPLGN